MNSGATQSLTVVVPAYNEQALLAGTVAGLHRALASLARPFEIVIVNDGSVDRTGAIADELSLSLASVSVVHQKNQGLGGALRTGFGAARGEFVLSWPADMPVDGGDLAPFVTALGSADVLVGVRPARAGYNPLMRFNSWLYPHLVSVLFGFRCRDVNWIHLYRTSLVRRVTPTERGIPMLVEMLVRLRDHGASFREVVVPMKPRTAGVATASRFRVMWRTLRGLFRFWWRWQGEERDPAASPARP